MRDERWQLTYINKAGAERSCYPRSKEKRDANIEICKQRGYKVVRCVKLYPFSSEKNQHNFELIRNICFNRMDDMESGEVEWNDQEYERLSDLRDKADKYFGLPLPVAWIPWDDWKVAHELAQMAIIHRQECCIENGRPDLVTYC